MIKEIAKKLCEKSSCHHKCHDTTDCVVEDEAREYLPFMLTNEGKVSENGKLLLINEDKSNNFDVKSNEELFKQALVEGLNRHFDTAIEEAKKIEQIEEMAHTILHFVNMKHGELSMQDIATHLYNEGWRKQSEGEWVRQKGSPEAICSNCGRDVVYQVIDNKWAFENYCPHCGAKMKGGEE